MKFIVEHLSKSFGEKRVLCDIDFTFEQGKIYGLLGRNGAGKTTLFNCLNGDIKYDAGGFCFETENGVRTPEPEDIGYVLSTPTVPDFMTGREFLKFFLEINEDRITNPKTIDEYFDFMSIEPRDRNKLLKEQSRKSISADSGITSNKKGFEYLNELFIKRHKKILWRSAKRITIGVLVIIAAVLVLFVYVPEAKSAVNGALMNFLPLSLFVMYILNRGTGFTQALFVNCDSSLLTYSFYKRPKFILRLFQIRLREIVKINLLPAAAIGGGLALLLYVSDGTDNPLNYGVLFVSVVALSIFFSVHYLTLYYLLQPYNAGTEIKSGTYKLAMWGTYMVCYIFLQMRFPTLIFGVATIVFCLAYCAAASLLVYNLAPKTFKIRA